MQKPFTEIDHSGDIGIEAHGADIGELLENATLGLFSLLCWGDAPSGRAQAVGERAIRETARRLGMTEGAVKVAVHRLRQRYRELLRTEIAETVAGPSDIDDEMRYLLAALRRE